MLAPVELLQLVQAGRRLLKAWLPPNATARM
jgi:hypothetical protein